ATYSVAALKYLSQNQGNHALILADDFLTQIPKFLTNTNAKIVYYALQLIRCFATFGSDDTKKIIKTSISEEQIKQLESHTCAQVVKAAQQYLNVDVKKETTDQEEEEEQQEDNDEEDCDLPNVITDEKDLKTEVKGDEQVGQVGKEDENEKEKDKDKVNEKEQSNQDKQNEQIKSEIEADLSKFIKKEEEEKEKEQKEILSLLQDNINNKDSEINSEQDKLTHSSIIRQGIQINKFPNSPSEFELLVLTERNQSSTRNQGQGLQQQHSILVEQETLSTEEQHTIDNKEVKNEAEINEKEQNKKQLQETNAFIDAKGHLQTFNDDNEKEIIYLQPKEHSYFELYIDSKKDKAKNKDQLQQNELEQEIISPRKLEKQIQNEIEKGNKKQKQKNSPPKPPNSIVDKQQQITEKDNENKEIKKDKENKLKIELIIIENQQNNEIDKKQEKDKDKDKDKDKEKPKKHRKHKDKDKSKKKKKDDDKTKQKNSPTGKEEFPDTPDSKVSEQQLDMFSDREFFSDKEQELSPLQKNYQLQQEEFQSKFDNQEKLPVDQLKTKTEAEIELKQKQDKENEQDQELIEKLSQKETQIIESQSNEPEIDNNNKQQQNFQQQSLQQQSIINAVEEKLYQSLFKDETDQLLSASLPFSLGTFNTNWKKEDFQYICDISERQLNQGLYVTIQLVKEKKEQKLVVKKIVEYENESDKHKYGAEIALNKEAYNLAIKQKQHFFLTSSPHSSSPSQQGIYTSPLNFFTGVNSNNNNNNNTNNYLSQPTYPNSSTSPSQQQQQQPNISSSPFYSQLSPSMSPRYNPFQSSSPMQQFSNNSKSFLSDQNFIPILAPLGFFEGNKPNAAHIVTEYCENGDLRRYIQHMRETRTKIKDGPSQRTFSRHFTFFTQMAFCTTTFDQRTFF
ncbi:MAG: hypothetical protein EZS28_029305, partial [Streblomastix strix]